MRAPSPSPKGSVPMTQAVLSGLTSQWLMASPHCRTKNQVSDIQSLGNMPKPNSNTGHHSAAQGRTTRFDFFTLLSDRGVLETERDYTTLGSTFQSDGKYGGEDADVTFTAIV